MPSAPYRHERVLTAAQWAALLDLVTQGGVQVALTTPGGGSAVLIGADELAELQQEAAAHRQLSAEVVLTPREQEVLTHVATGASTAEVADTLDLAVSTVTAHLASARRKYGVRSSAAAAARALGRPHDGPAAG